MCEGMPGARNDAATAGVAAAAEQGPGPREVIPLAPVEAVTITTLVDNVVDVLLPDGGPARRPQRDRATVAGATLDEGFPWSSPGSSGLASSSLSR